MRTENAERRHPMQVFVAAMLTLSGLGILLGGPQPGSLSENLPALLVQVVAAVFAAGGALVVAAAISPNPVTALYLEFAGAVPLALVLVAYASGAVTLAGGRAAVAVALMAGLALAFTVRAVLVYRTIRDLRTALGRRRR